MTRPESALWEDKARWRLGEEWDSPCPVCGEQVQELVHTQQMEPEVHPVILLMVPCADVVEPGSPLEWKPR